MDCLLTDPTPDTASSRSTSITASPIQNSIPSFTKVFDVSTIPPHPISSAIQRGGVISVHTKHLYLNATQAQCIRSIYDGTRHFHKIYSDSPVDQTEACQTLGAHGLDVMQLCQKDTKDLGNGWSRRWSSKEGKDLKLKERVLLQCQCGSSSEARKKQDDESKTKRGLKVNNTQAWNRKMPYDFTECLAHIDITYYTNSLEILRITGILDHNPACESQAMQRLPPIPLHPHVWQVALNQLDNGASISAIQAHNRHLCNSQLYDGQIGLDPMKANVRYMFLPQDSSRLYKIHARLQGVDLLQPPEQNINDWLDPASPLYKPTLAEAIFYYQARTGTSDRFKACIQTSDMKSAAWKYAHGRQLILDGTFGICDRRILLFIGMAVDEKKKGVPIVFLLFSAPTGTQATHAGYDSDILTELLRAWKTALGKGPDGVSFQPKTAITDTDTKERAALTSVWPNILLLLCKFHTRMAWANKRKALVKTGNKPPDFFKQQIITRIRNLDSSLIASEDYQSTKHLIQAERNYLTMMSTDPDTSISSKNGLAYLDYLNSNWMSEALWKSWSHFGRLEASRILGIPVQDVIPTTNHLESFNSILKHKYIMAQQRGGKRLRFDLLIFLLVIQVLPAIFARQKAESSFYDWLSRRFSQYAEENLVHKKEAKMKQQLPRRFDFTWWTAEGRLRCQDEVAHILKQKRIGQYNWLGPYQLAATCASSVEDIRLISHKRYTMAINCYGWARCSCPAFEKFGYACKHLWAFRIAIAQMQTPYAFIFPESFEQAHKIYSTIFIPPTSTSTSTVNQPQAPSLVDETLRPLPLSGSLSGTTNDFDEILEMVMKPSENDIVSDTEEDPDNDEIPGTSDVESELEENPRMNETIIAINSQRNARLAYDIKTILPKLHGIRLTLRELGPAASISPELEEFFMLTNKISALAKGDGKSEGSFNSVKDMFIDQATTEPRTTIKRTVDPTLRPPSPERSQKRKKSTSIF